MILVAVAPAGAAGPALPLELPAAARTRLEPIARAATVTTRWEAEGFPARLPVFEFLIDHPEFTSHVTRALKAGRYRIWQTSEGLFLDDGWGATGRLEVVHAARGVRVMYARVRLEQRVLPSVPGDAIVVLEYAVTSGPVGIHRIAPTVSGFVTLDSRLYAAATHLASAMAQAKADKEARRLAKTLRRITTAIENNPAHVFDVLRRHPDVPARELEEFRKLLSLPGIPSP